MRERDSPCGLTHAWPGFPVLHEDLPGLVTGQMSVAATPDKGRVLWGLLNARGCRCCVVRSCQAFRRT